MKQVKGFLSLVLAGVIFGSFGVLIRLLGRELSTFQQIGFRNLIAILIALVLMVINRSSIKSLKKVKFVHVLSFGLFFPLSVLFFVLSFLTTKIILGIFSFYIGSILFSLLLGLILFKEKFTAQKIISLILVLIGLLFFVVPAGVTGFSLGIVYALVAGFFDAVSNSYRKHLGVKVDKLVLTSIPLIGGLIVMVVMMLIAGESFTPIISNFSWIIGLIFGLLLFLVNYLTIVGFKNFDLNLGTIILSSELFFASIFGFIFFKEIPVWNETVGGLMVILAVINSNLNFGKRK